jgi:hypothetical protein
VGRRDLEGLELFRLCAFVGAEGEFVLDEDLDGLADVGGSFAVELGLPVGLPSDDGQFDGGGPSGLYL